MKRILLIAGLLLIAGCKGPKGDKGDTGAAGPGGIVTFGGDITSDNQTVTNSAITVDSNVTVLVNANYGKFTELPVWSPMYSVNVVAQIGNGSLIIVNAKTVGMTYYYVIIVTKNAPAASMKMRLLS